MINIYNLENSITDDTEKARLSILIQNETKLFKILYETKCTIVYQPERKPEIESYLGIKIDDSAERSFYESKEFLNLKNKSK